MKKFILKIYYCFVLSKENANFYQKMARDVEWDAVKQYIKEGLFLDVGCGAGYSMKKAQEEFNCICSGIDPNPSEHGVGRINSNYNVGIDNILFGKAEDIPFSDKYFDTVYSSHVLEHVDDINKSLQEMKRVMKDNGILIIGMPTATMAVINLITQVLFATHTKIVNLLFSKFINTGKIKWWEIFIPVSHSNTSKTVISDIYNYRVKRWTAIIEQNFKIIKQIKPALYPYPEYRQLFKLRISKRISSSIFYICIK